MKTIMVTLILGATMCAQTPKHLWTVADYCASLTQDAKERAQSAQDAVNDENCKLPEFTKRCIGDELEISRISNRTRVAACAAKTPREAREIAIKGSTEVLRIEQEDAKFFRLQADKARANVDKIHKQIADQKAFCIANNIPKFFDQINETEWVFTAECTSAYLKSGKLPSDLYLPGNPSLNRLH